MNITQAVLIAEGSVESDEILYIESWQYLIDTGACWSLQGWFGRTAEQMIESGICIYNEENENEA